MSLVGTNLSSDTDKNNNEAVTEWKRKEDRGQRAGEVTRDLSTAENCGRHDGCEELGAREGKRQITENSQTKLVPLLIQKTAQ